MKRQFQSVINALQEGWFLAGLRVTFANRFAKFLVPHLNRVGIVYFLGHNEGLFSCASLALQDVTLSRPRRINSTFGLVLYKKWIFADPWPRLFSTPDKNELRSLAKPREKIFPLPIGGSVTIGLYPYQKSNRLLKLISNPAVLWKTASPSSLRNTP